jgi:hypothetical protein
MISRFRYSFVMNIGESWVGPLGVLFLRLDLPYHHYYWQRREGKLVYAEKKASFFRTGPWTADDITTNVVGCFFFIYKNNESILINQMWMAMDL